MSAAALLQDAPSFDVDYKLATFADMNHHGRCCSARAKYFKAKWLLFSVINLHIMIC